MPDTDNRQIAAILTAGMITNHPNTRLTEAVTRFFQCLDELENEDKVRREAERKDQPQVQ